MGHAHFDQLSESQREATQTALRHVLGTVPVDGVTPLAGGFTTAAVSRIEAGGRRYVLRVEGTPSPLRNPHQYQSMRIAADAGIAPRLYYADEDSRVAVIDHVETRPLGSFPGGPPALARALGELLRRLQATEVFPYFVDYPAIVARLWAHVCRTGLFADGVLDPVNERLAEIRGAYVWDRAHSVSCHNDPVPANILYDGKRLWLIDWESAYRNDPLVDVAIMSDHFARTEELQAALLQAWLGRAPDAALLARLWAHVCRTGLFAPGVLDPVNERLAGIREAYVWNGADSVSCHNDPVPANILYDGKRLWLIDWESAYRNDPLVDVAIMSDHFARTEELQATLLQAWLGRAPDAALLERLKHVTALTRLYYAGVFLSASALVPRAAPDTGLAAPTMPALEQAVAAGRFKFGTRAHNHVVGKMFLASFLRNVPTPRF